MGNVELARSSVKDKYIQERLNQAYLSCLRAKDLTDHLMRFVRIRNPILKPMRLSEMVSNLAKVQLINSGY
jgi:hypothetical protein